MKIVFIFTFGIIAAQCHATKIKRDVSELPFNGVQTKPNYVNQESLDAGYSYPKPGIQTRPIYREPETVNIQSRPIFRDPQPEPVVETRPIYRPQEPNFIQTRPIYRQPEPNFIQTRPIYREPEPSIQTRPIYREPQPNIIQTRPIYREPEQTYIQTRPIFREQNNVQTRPIYEEPNFVQTKPNIPQQGSNGYSYPKPYDTESVTTNSAAQTKDTSQRIFFPLWNKFQGVFPPNNQYPGMNNIGYPGGSGSGGYPGNYPNKFPLFNGLFPTNNYDGNYYQRIETSSPSDGQFKGNQEEIGGVNSIGFVGVTTLDDEATRGTGYDYPNPNEQQPPFETPDVQFRSVSSK